MTNARQPKPAYAAWAMPLWLPTTSMRKGKQVEVWGGARPAHFAKAPQRVRIRFRSGSKGAFKTLKTVTLRNKRGYFDIKMSFPSSGQVKTLWNGKDSRTQNIRVR